MVGAGITLAAATLPGGASFVSSEDVTRPGDVKANDEFAVTGSLIGVINLKSVFGPDAVMPGLYSLKVGKHVRTDSAGKTILSA
jgi:hypothetical protein